MPLGMEQWSDTGVSSAKCHSWNTYQQEQSVSSKTEFVMLQHSSSLWREDRRPRVYSQNEPLMTQDLIQCVSFQQDTCLWRTECRSTPLYRYMLKSAYSQAAKLLLLKPNPTLNTNFKKNGGNQNFASCRVDKRQSANSEVYMFSFDKIDISFILKTLN